MSRELKLPDLGEGLTEGEVARWLVAEGDEVAEDDPLLEIETDKTTVEIPSPYAGRVARILVGAGEVVPVGTVLVAIEGAEDAGTPAPAGGRVRATPLVRRLADELGVDLTQVRGSGPNGQIVEGDVRADAAARTSPETTGRRREKVRGIRRATVEHLTAAHREIPAVTFVEECDFTGVDLGLLVPLALK